MQKITQAQKSAWILALKSGDYKQGQHALRTHDSAYCCLGVLAEQTCDKVENRDDEERPTRYYFNIDLGEEDFTGSLPGELISDDVQSMLIHLNDTKRFTFEQIADVVAALPLGALQNGFAAHDGN